MSTAVMRLPADDSRGRTGGSMVVSVLLHALLLMWLVLAPHGGVSLAPVTEITLLEPGDLVEAAAAPAPAPAGERQSPGARVASQLDAHFRRAASRAELTPDPQSDRALEDRLNARLATLQGSGREVVPVASPAPSALWGSSPAAAGVPGGSGTAPLALHRGGAGSGPALELTRGSGGGMSPALAPSLAAPRVERDEAPARAGDATAHRTLAGATLAGPISDREILARSTPVYPEWAKHEGVEGSVTLYFLVRPDGSVRENVLVQKTAGFEDFDESARAALRAWRFAPLRAGRAGDQWGTVTFNFRLREGG